MVKYNGTFLASALGCLVLTTVVAWNTNVAPHHATVRRPLTRTQLSVSSQTSWGNDPEDEEPKTQQRRNRNGMAAFFAGMGLAAHFAVTAPVAAMGPPPQTVELGPTQTLLAAGNNFETLDFSMPSYSETEGGSKSSSGSAGSSLMGKLDIKKEKEDTPSDTKAAAPAKGSDADDEEAKKAAKEKLKAERLAEARKYAAEQAERRAAAEKEAEKAKPEEKAPAPAPAPVVVAPKPAPAPAPVVVAPKPAPAPAPAKEEELKPKPSFKLPEVEVPDVKMPSFSVPPAPKFDVPKIETPKIDVPKFDVPKVEAPKVDVPKFDVPKVEAPKVSVPKIETPKAPPAPVATKTATYNLDVPDDENTTPQEVRDAAAREAKLAFKKVDREAKEIEKQAREARGKANLVYKDFLTAKDEACKTRPGGKVLCLRGFGIGY